MTLDEILWLSLSISDRVAILDAGDGSVVGFRRSGDTMEKMNAGGIFLGPHLEDMNAPYGPVLDGGPRFRLQLLPPAPAIGKERAV